MPSVLVTGLKAHGSGSREARSEGVPEGAVPNAHDADRIRKRICATWLTAGGRFARLLVACNESNRFFRGWMVKTGTGMTAPPFYCSSASAC